MLKTALRVVTLVLCAIIGLWAVAHGFALVATAKAPSHEDMLQYLLEVSVSIACGGTCAVSGCRTTYLLANSPKGRWADLNCRLRMAAGRGTNPVSQPGQFAT